MKKFVIKKGRPRAAFREYRFGKRGQRRCEGCSIIRSRPNGFLNTFDISLDMDHLLLCCLPAASM